MRGRLGESWSYLKVCTTVASQELSNWIISFMFSRMLAENNERLTCDSVTYYSVFTPERLFS